MTAGQSVRELPPVKNAGSPKSAGVRNLRLGCVGKLQRYLISGGLAYVGALSAGLRAVLTAGRVEMEAPIVVLLTVSRAGVPIMRVNGKSRLHRRPGGRKGS